MQSQLNLFEQKKSIYNAFVKFDKSNPKVYQLFKQFFFQLKNRGIERVGAKLIMERIRYEMKLTIQSNEEFQLNNNYTCHYARKFIMDFPEHEHRFETRQLRSL